MPRKNNYQIASLEHDGLGFYEERYSSAGASALHSHEETELVLLLEGTVDDVRKEQTVRRSPSTLLVLPAGELHAPRVHAGVRFFQIRIKPPWLKRFPQCAPRWSQAHLPGRVLRSLLIPQASGNTEG